MLGGIEREQAVTIPLAIESGSRAWGFPSPDSDYDCRFIFIRPPAETYSLFPRRDVIELPTTPVLDVNGWELGKALKLMLAGNAVVVEWLMSPLVYRSDEEFRVELLQLARQVARRDLIGKHYYHLARGQHERFLGADSVPLKKAFYVLRPLMALRWLEAHPDAAFAPMAFGELCAGAGLDEATREQIAALQEMKGRSRELGEGPLPSAIASFIALQMDRAAKWAEAAQPAPDTRSKALVDGFWRRWVERPPLPHASS